MKNIYLDNNATTEVSSSAIETEIDILRNYYGNASSLYPLGNKSKKILEEARSILKANIGAGEDDQIIFTSCATESNNAVFFSAINSFPQKRHIIISAVEHMSIIRCAEYWKAQGYEISIIGVDSKGNIDLDEFKRSIRKDTLLVSIMMANNETGVVFPISELVSIVREKSPSTFFHTDAVQAIGKIPVNVFNLGVDFLSLSGHKFHAPKGVGALYVKSSTPYCSFIKGGHQEFNLRAGTENIPHIAALSRAAKDIPNLIAQNNKNVVLRNYLEKELLKIGDILIHGYEANRIPNTTNVSAKGLSGVELSLKLAKMGICVSHGSACNSKNAEPSHVLQAMKVPVDYIDSIRISLSTKNNGADIAYFIDCYKKIVSYERSKNGNH